VEGGGGAEAGERAVAVAHAPFIAEEGGVKAELQHLDVAAVVPPHAGQRPRGVRRDAEVADAALTALGAVGVADDLGPLAAVAVALLFGGVLAARGLRRAGGVVRGGAVGGPGAGRVDGRLAGGRRAVGGGRG